MAEKEGTKGKTREKLPDDRSRRTFIVLDKDSDYLDSVAHWDRKYIMEVLSEAIDLHRKAYIKKHGAPPEIIKKRTHFKG
jgi:hypothetical protein